MPTKKASELKHMEDFIEGSYPFNSMVFYGCRVSKYSLNLGRVIRTEESLQLYYHQFDQKIGYYGSVFYPERRWVSNNHGEWMREEFTYEKNQAFWAGAIQAGKPFLLITPIEHYGYYFTGVCSELLWLENNGYTFVPDPLNPSHTLAIPPLSCLLAPVQY